MSWIQSNEELQREGHNQEAFLHLVVSLVEVLLLLACLFYLEAWANKSMSEISGTHIINFFCSSKN